MADLWHYTSDGKPMPPVSPDELRELAQAGLLKPSDLVWHDGMPEWAPASKARGLFDSGATLSVLPLGEKDMPAARPEAHGDRRPARGSLTESARREDERQRRQPIRNEGMSTGAVVGILVGAGVLILVIAVVAVLMLGGGRERRHVVNGPFVRENPPPFPPVERNERPHNMVILEHPPALGAPRAVPPKGLVINDQLTDNDPRDFELRFAPCKVYPIKMVAGSSYTIDMVSQELDAYLRMEDGQFVALALDDDSGGDLNARLIFVAPENGIYRVIVTSFNGATGRFTLRIRAGK